MRSTSNWHVRLLRLWLLAGLGAAAASGAQALQVTRLSPQGEVAQVRQVVARFDRAAVAFGAPQSAAPLTVRCDDAEAARGNGRWTSDREWTYDFATDLPPGVRCTVERAASFRPRAGDTWRGAERFEFHTGGPFVRRWQPAWGAIDERQIFLLELNGPAAPASIDAHVWCEASDLGERIPVRRVEGAERAAVLKALRREDAAARAPLSHPTLQCNRTLSPGSRVQLVWGAGVATPSGVANTVEKRLDFEVREPFAVSFSCERENAQADCLPLRPLVLGFNAPVTRRLAAQITMQSGGRTLRPSFDAAASKDPESVVDRVQFAPPFAERARFTIELPAGFEDASGRALATPQAFPMQVATGVMPPLAKFAAAPFGVVERLAEPDGGALMPLTVRRVEPELRLRAFTPGRLNDLQPRTDAEIIAWYRKVRRYEERSFVTRQEAARDVRGPLPPVVDADRPTQVETRALALLAGQPGVRSMELPRSDAQDPRPFEVIGVPLTPGFHVLELSSQRLGDALLDPGYGAERAMVVRTSALATNLAVHFKLGRENAFAWVTSLDKGQAVANASVRVSDCRGKLLATGVTDALGRVSLAGLSPEPPNCAAQDEYEEGAYFVSARATDVAGVEDLAFTWSDWQRGIEPWRFNVPTSLDAAPDRSVHTIFDRTLLRAGETVSMKHLVRTRTLDGFGLPRELPRTLVITHVGSGQEFTQPLAWRSTPTGGRSAQSRFVLPATARLGVYQVALREAGATGAADARSLPSGSFRVEEFRLPVMDGRIAPVEQRPLIAPTRLPVAVQVDYVGGGPAARLPVQVSALVRGHALAFADFDDFSFDAPSREGAVAASAQEAESGADETLVVADKLPLTLNAQGAGQVEIARLPPTRAAPRDLLLEATYADPNGELQTLRGTRTLWPAEVVAGIKTEGWVSSGRKVAVQALALDLDGKPRAGVTLNVRAIARTVTSSRKRLVGGFYTYDNKTETRDIGTVCSGKSDARGLLLCAPAIDAVGEVELIASATDAQGRDARAARTVYLTREGELWFGGSDNDRIDVLPEKKSYMPGEVARFQVRSPFRVATALVSVEREGIRETHVVTLDGKDPTVSLEVKRSWGPNVYVSVLAVRGRIREVPWYSFFTWGFRTPREWWNAFWIEGRQYVAPTALVDLSKPAYRIGLAEIRVGVQAHRIDVQLESDRADYPVRGQAEVRISARYADGKPAAGAEVAVAAVDEALLELMPNDSWNLLEAMLQRRSWGVATATAQMEIVGRRHYGRKAVPAGGGGGHSATRELLDTLLLWQPAVRLDDSGRATVTVPFNDALSRFRVVAVADAGTDLFGTGQTTLRTTQDLQIVSGLPPLVREGDRFRAQVTLRNTTGAAMKVEARPEASGLPLESRTVELPAGEARELAWEIDVPAQAAEAGGIDWRIEARDMAGGNARDALRVRQRVVPAVPVTVQQATLVQLDRPYRQAVAPPADALPGRGGLRLQLQASLGSGLAGVRDWFQRYPYTCLEQQASRAIGLRDAAAWGALMERLPGYLDADGLASYFPAREGDAPGGSDVLTAYLLAASHEAAALDPAFALPTALRVRMVRGLAGFVEGRVSRDTWSPRADLDARKLAALEALSRHGEAHARMADSLTIAPAQWPTSALLDWLRLLERWPDLPRHAQRTAEADQVLRARLAWRGSRVVLGNEAQDNWWWLMVNGDVNAARLLLAKLDEAAWRDDLGRIASGLIARQQRGAWSTTTANLWGSLAIEKFARRFESSPVSGSTRAALGETAAGFDWPAPAPANGSAPTDAARAAPATTPLERLLPWPTPGAGETELLVTHAGAGQPWLTVQSLAAVPPGAPVAAGYALRRSVEPVQQATPGELRRGDILRVRIEIDAAQDMRWVALTDPLPGGATLLGSGLGRDSSLATRDERRARAGQESVQPSFEERRFEFYRAYYAFLPKGLTRVDYTVRLNGVGQFALPPTRIEALYAPEVFGTLPNARMVVGAP